MMKAAFLPPSVTCPVVTVTTPKCFPDARIDNQQLHWRRNHGGWGDWSPPKICERGAQPAELNVP